MRHSDWTEPGGWFHAQAIFGINIANRCKQNGVYIIHTRGWMIDQRKPGFRHVRKYTCVRRRTIFYTIKRNTQTSCFLHNYAHIIYVYMLNELNKERQREIYIYVAPAATCTHKHMHCRLRARVDGWLPVSREAYWVWRKGLDSEKKQKVGQWHKKRWVHISRLLDRATAIPNTDPHVSSHLSSLQASFLMYLWMPVKVELATLMPLWTLNLGVESPYFKYDI